MKGIFFGLTLCLAQPAMAQTCPTFDIDSDYLNGFFCGQLGQIIGPRTRTIEPQNPISSDDDALKGWLDLQIISDAYRVDPSRTLELIQRIKDAGGVPMQ